MEKDADTNDLIPRFSKMQIRHPLVEWGRSWEYLRTKGLSGEQSSLWFQVFCNILPTRQRLFRLNIIASPICDLCTDNCEGSLEHSLLECSFNQVNDWILGVLIDIESNLIDEDLSSSNILTLNIPLKMEVRLAVTWFLSTVLGTVWRNRQSRRLQTLMAIRATIKGEISTFRGSKYRNIANIIDIATNFIS